MHGRASTPLSVYITVCQYGGLLECMAGLVLRLVSTSQYVNTEVCWNAWQG